MVTEKKKNVAEMEIDEAESKRVKNHKKREHPQRYSVSHSTWEACTAEYVSRLPNDINGMKVYVVEFDPEKRMKSSSDGRNWEAWKTSSRKGFSGRQRMTKCTGGWECVNDECPFRLTYNRSSCHHFLNKKDEEVKCKICEYNCTRVQCVCCKIWEFDDDTRSVHIYHYGDHKCSPKYYINIDDSQLRDNLKKIRKQRPSKQGGV